MAWKETLLFYKESPFQRIAFFTEKDGSFSLTLNDFWQFNSQVEHIYHECLFTMPSLFPDKLENVLVLGGGDGLGVRELLKYDTIKNIDLVDLDPEIIKFAKTNVFMKNLNEDSFNNPKVKITVTDAKKWLAKPVKRKYDLIIVDFPDPTTDDLWDLYTIKLYKRIAARLNENGVMAVQSSTYNTKTFDLIYEKLDKVFPFLLGYHTGASRVFCGFFIASFKPIQIHRPLPSCRWLTSKILNQILALPLLPTEDNKSKGKSPKTKGRGKSPKTKGRGKSPGLGEEEFFATETLSPPPKKGPSLITNPLVIMGILAVLAFPFVLRYL